MIEVGRLKSYLFIELNSTTQMPDVCHYSCTPPVVIQTIVRGKESYKTIFTRAFTPQHKPKSCASESRTEARDKPGNATDENSCWIFQAVAGKFQGPLQTATDIMTYATTGSLCKTVPVPQICTSFEDYPIGL